MKIKLFTALLIGSCVAFAANNLAQQSFAGKQTKTAINDSNVSITQYTFKIKNKSGSKITDIVIKAKDGKEIYKNGLDCTVKKNKCEAVIIDKQKINPNSWPLIFNFFNSSKLISGNIVPYTSKNKFKLIINNTSQDWGIYAFGLMQIKNQKYKDNPQDLLKLLNEKMKKDKESTENDVFERLGKKFEKKVVNGKLSENNFFNTYM